jgi:nucleotide-binding universal stress UspA family protein
MMEKHLLVTVSDQLSAMHAVRFVGHFFSNKESMNLTMFYAAAKPPRLWEGERTVDSVGLAEQQAKESEIKGRKALEAARRELFRAGFRDDQINAKLQFRQFSKAMDIIQEGEKGLYDAVVLGRRGLSWLEEVFDESVSKGLLEKKVSFPLWICRKPDLERRNVLVCVDGSDACYRMVEHVGFILDQEKNQAVTLLVVAKKGGRWKENAEKTLLTSKEVLCNHGFPEALTKTKLVEAGNVARAILREADDGRFAVVTVGRTGAGEGLLRKVFMGSVSTTLFTEIEKASLWICQ